MLSAVQLSQPVARQSTPKSQRVSEAVRSFFAHVRQAFRTQRTERSARRDEPAMPCYYVE